MPFTGMLKIIIIEASDLKPTQISFRHVLVKNPSSMVIDPFVAVAIDDNVLEKTTSKPRTFKPVWNESFTLELLDSKKLELTVFHKTAFADEFVANYSILIDDILAEIGNENEKQKKMFWVIKY